MNVKLCYPLMLVFSTIMLSGCMATGSNNNGSANSSGHISSISMVDSSERRHLNTRVALNDIIAFSENLTNKMLQSQVFSNLKKKPRVIVGKIKQNNPQKGFNELCEIVKYKGGTNILYAIL